MLKMNRDPREFTVMLDGVAMHKRQAIEFLRSTLDEPDWKALAHELAEALLRVKNCCDCPPAGEALEKFNKARGDK